VCVCVCVCACVRACACVCVCLCVYKGRLPNEKQHAWLTYHAPRVNKLPPSLFITSSLFEDAGYLHVKRAGLITCKIMDRPFRVPFHISLRCVCFVVDNETAFSRFRRWWWWCSRARYSRFHCPNVKRSLVRIHSPQEGLQRCPAPPAPPSVSGYFLQISSATRERKRNEYNEAFDRRRRRLTYLSIIHVASSPRPSRQIDAVERGSSATHRSLMDYNTFIFICFHAESKLCRAERQVHARVTCRRIDLR